VLLFRFGRPGAAVRSLSFPLIPLIPLVASLAAAAPVSAAELSGQIVDSTGRVVPRAHVRIVAESGPTRVGAFTDDEGRFTLTLDLPAGCRLEVSMAGFQTVAAPCAPNARVELAVAPVREDIIVSATRTDTPTSQAGASATVFTAQDLERLQRPLLADLVANTPGAMLIRYGGPGTVTSLFVRGGESNYNKVLLDGVPLNEPGGTFFLNNLTTENLERVEIVRGAYSSLFGSDAMASVIQLVTKRPDRSSRPAVSAALDGGTYGTVHATASASGASGRFDYSLGAARFDSDNRVPNSALANTTLSANAGLSLGDAATIHFIARSEREHVGTPGQTAFGPPDLDAFFERHDGVGSVQFDQRLGRSIRQRASYSLAASSQQSTNLVADPPFTASYQGRVAVYQSNDFLNDTTNRLHRHHAEYQADATLPGVTRTGTQLLTVLGDWDGERVTATDRLATIETSHARNNAGVSVQDQMLWPRVFVTIGGRVERNASFGAAFVPRGTVVYIAHAATRGLGDTRLKASAGTGIKEPTLIQSFSVSPYFLGNADLKPERSRSVEVGVEQRLAADRAKLELTYFHNRFSDVIQLVTTNPATYEGMFFNTGATRARGLEFGAEAAPVKYLRARAAYTLLDGKVVESAIPDDTVFALGQALFRRPRHSGSVGVSVSWERVTADVVGTFVGRFVDSDFGLFSPSFTENPGHTTWDLRASLALTRRLTGVLTVDNLTNRDYSEPLGFQPLRRAVRIGARVKF
jgi:vitamin B12 transporter